MTEHGDSLLIHEQRMREDRFLCFGVEKIRRNALAKRHNGRRVRDIFGHDNFLGKDKL